MNRKKFKQVVAKTVRDDDIDYVTSSEEDEVNEPLDFEPNDELLPKPYRPNDGFGGAVNALPRDENPGRVREHDKPLLALPLIENTSLL